MAETTPLDILNTDPEVLGLQRQRQLANLLTGQAFNQPQGQIISGHYVAPSALQQALPMINAAIGGLTNANLDEKQLAMAEALRQKQKQAVQGYFNALNPQQTELAGPTPTNKPLMTVNQPDYMKALEIGTGENAPAWLKSLTAEELKTQKVGEGEKIVRKNPFTGQEQIIAQGGEKFQRPIEVNTGNGTQLLDARTLKPIGFVPKVKGEGEVNPQEAPLRTQFFGQIQPHIQISQAYAKITSAPDSAAGDMSKIFGFMKILDPSSTVREGEYASAEQTRGIPQAVVAQYNRALEGRRLTQEQRDKFDQAAGDLVSSQKKQFNQQKQFFTNVALNAKANPSNVIFDPYEGLDVKTTPPKAPPKPLNQQLNIPAADLFKNADAIISGGK